MYATQKKANQQINPKDPRPKPLVGKPLPLPGSSAEAAQMPMMKMTLWNPEPAAPSVPLPTTAPTAIPLTGPTVKPPRPEIYNIHLPGIDGNHHMMKSIYEAVLPKELQRFRSISISQRTQIRDYMRNLLTVEGDGEDISLTTSDTEKENLFSLIKLMQMNPDHYSTLSDNPYKSLPNGLLVYRSCFPIKFDRRGGVTVCSPNSIGFNIRIYSLSIAEYFSYILNTKTYLMYDVWRELAIYQYILDALIKPKICPHFALLYTYYLSTNQTIDFFKMKQNCLTQKDRLTSEYQRLLQTHRLFSKSEQMGKLMGPFERLIYTAGEIVAKLPDERDPRLQAYSGNCLVMVTEAPTQGLYGWASRRYELDGAVRQMVSDGYHDVDVWNNVLFQVLYTLAVMQRKGVALLDMTIADNIKIKDIQGSKEKNDKHWRYVMDGVTYYLPNRGYLAIIDSNFKDIPNNGRRVDCCDRAYKGYLHKELDREYTMKSLSEIVVVAYRNIMTPNAFTGDHMANKVNRPPEAVLEKLDAMTRDTETDLGKVLAKYFNNYTNNRVGTYLTTDVEAENVRDNDGSLRRGDMVVEVVGPDTYKWALVLQVEGTQATILTRQNPDDRDRITKTIRRDTLRKYAQSVAIAQNTRPYNFNEEHLIETYVCGSSS